MLLNQLLIIIVLYNRYVEDTFLAMKTLKKYTKKGNILIWTDGEAAGKKLLSRKRTDTKRATSWVPHSLALIQSRSRRGFVSVRRR